jgi:dipeptidyl aminopeptidase/acylaminoacyl peptidase
MKSIFLFFIALAFNAEYLHCQVKPAIDTAAFKKWPTLSSPMLSADGKYTYYKIRNNQYGVDTLVIQSTDAKWSKKVINSGACSFTANGDKLIYVNPGDSLSILNLATKSFHYIPNVAYFFPLKNDIHDWIIYQIKGHKGQFAAFNLKNGKQRLYESIVDFKLSNDGKNLVLQKELSKNGLASQELIWVDLASNTSSRIWSGAMASDVTFDASNQHIAFLERKTDDNDCANLFHYNSVTKQTIKVIDYLNEPSLSIRSIERFSSDGSTIFINWAQKDKHETLADELNLNIWSYNDLKMQPEQVNELNNPVVYLAAALVDQKKLVYLQKKNESVTFYNDKYAVLRYQSGSPADFLWNSRSVNAYYMVSIKNGDRFLLKDIQGATDVFASPQDKFIISYDPKLKSYLSYEVSTATIRRITKNIKSFNLARYTRGVAGWLPNDKAVLIYDDYDIYQIDPLQIHEPINLTNGFGRKSNITFNYLEDGGEGNKIIELKKEMILSAFNISNKKNGFYRIKRNSGNDPEVLTMDNSYYGLGKSGFQPSATELFTFLPISDLKGSIYLLQRARASEFGAIYSTKDFKTFTQLSNIHPEKPYNWYTTEMHSWKTLKGNIVYGTLYKPENFDPTKKYPVIFDYYTLRSSALNVYIKPNHLTLGCTINIPYFVSNGYLVVTPDIVPETDIAGQDVVSSIVSAAGYFSKLPFVNPKKMGITGYSFGGYETYQLITQTNLFSAASGGGGVTDLISTYGSLRSKMSNQGGSTGKLGGAMLWGNIDLYVKNSPVLNAVSVTTPLLMMHTTEDGAVNFTQAIEFFTALRSLGKKAWLLEYTDGNHGIFGKSAMDYSTRLMQFFDHYLKDKPAPLWMLEGRPAELKGKDNRLQLDTLGHTPGPGLIVPH